MIAALLQIDGYDPVAATAVTLRASSVDDDRVCHLNGQTWLPAFTQLPALRYDLFDGDFSGRISTPQTSISLAIEDWPNFARYLLADARVQIWTGDPGDTWGSWTLRFDGRAMGQPEIRDGMATLTLAVDDRWLDKPLLATYAGTTGVEGDAPIKGTAKPLALGAPRYVPGVMIDTVNTVLQLSAYGAIQSVEYAMERLARFGASIGDYASYSALVAATIPAGQWATCKAAGLVRHGAPPAGQLSYHVQGDNAGTDGWARTPGKLIRRIALLAGGSGKVDDTSLNNLDAARPWNVSLYVSEQTTARQLIQRLAASVNAVAGVDWLGKLFAVPVGFGTSSLTLDATGAALPPVGTVEQLEIASPFWKLAIGALPTWSVHALADVAFTALLVDRGRYDGAETYREGHVVDLADGSKWIYVNPTPTSGIAPPAWPTTSSAWWENISPPLELGAVGDANRVRFSQMERGTLGYGLFDATASSIAALDQAASAGKRYVHTTGSFTANGQECSIGTAGLADAAFRIPVTPSERLWVGAQVGVINPSSSCTARLIVYFYDATDAVIDAAEAYASNGSDTFPYLRGGFVDTPAGAVWAAIRLNNKNNSLGITGAFTLYLAEPMVCAAGASQTVSPTFSPGPSGEFGAEVNRWVDNPTQSLEFTYDYQGNADSGQFPRDLTLKLNSSGGVIATGISWSYIVKSGTVNGVNNASGSQSISGSGATALAVSGLGTDNASVEVTATYGTGTYKLTIPLSRKYAAAPTGGGGGGGGGSTTLASKSSGFTSINSTTFTDLSGWMPFDVPAGISSVNLNATLNFDPTAGLGTKTIELKWQQNVGGTPTDVTTPSPTVQSGVSDRYNDPDFGQQEDPALITNNKTLSVTGGSTGNQVRLMGRLTSGTSNHNVTGNASVTT